MESSIAPRFEEVARDAVAGINVGDPGDPATEVGHATVDLNGDGRPDLVQASGAGFVQVLIAR